MVLSVLQNYSTAITTAKLRSAMKTNQFISVLVCCVLLAKLTRLLKAEDCVDGTFLSTYMTKEGTCVSCPRQLKDCYKEQIADQSSCLDRCVNLTPKPKSKTNATKIIRFQPTPSTTINSNGSSAVVYQSAKHPPEINEGQKSPIVKEGLGKEIWIAIGCGLFVLILMIVAIVLYHKIQPDGHRDEDGGRNARNQMVRDLEPLHPNRNDPELQQAGRIDEEQIGVQEEELSHVRIGGIQDTETPTNFSSSLNVDQNCY